MIIPVQVTVFGGHPSSIMRTKKAHINITFFVCLHSFCWPMGKTLKEKQHVCKSVSIQQPIVTNNLLNVELLEAHIKLITLSFAQSRR